MLNRLILKVTKFQLPPLKRLGTVVKNILGGHHAPPPMSNRVNSYFDVLLDNTFKVEQKIKYKSDLGITGRCIQWNISRCTVTKGTVILKKLSK